MTFYVFFFNDAATTEIYTLSLHDALPIFRVVTQGFRVSYNNGVVLRNRVIRGVGALLRLIRSSSQSGADLDRKSTRLNSSHSQISYAVFCLKKKKFKMSDHYSRSRSLCHC